VFSHAATNAATESMNIFGQFQQFQLLSATFTDSPDISVEEDGSLIMFYPEEVGNIFFRDSGNHVHS
jgi:hypothetical protein